LAARRLTAGIAIAGSAFATLPYVVFNLGVIASTEGSIVHMAPAEWAIFTAVSSLVLWLGSAAIVVLSSIATRHNAWLSTPLAMVVFAGIATLLDPGFWPRLFEPDENGFGYWVFVAGALSPICALLLKWMAKPDVRLG